MPRLPKFKDVHISPLTGPMNSLTPLDLLSEKQFRYVKNFRVDGAGRLRRIGGLKPLFNDGNYNVAGAIKNNSDLHDQLGSKQSPTNSINEYITLLFEFESGSGSRKLIAATKSRIYALNQRSRNWVLIGDNGGSGFAEGTSTSYSPVKFKAAQLGNNIVLSNNYDEPLYWYFDRNPKLENKNLVQKITDLTKLKITKAGHVCEYKGFMFLANLEENGSQQIAKVQWSDYVDATSYYPSTSSLSGQQTVGDVGESIIGMAVLGDHLIIYKERSIWRCSLVSSANLFVFKQIYQGENTPYYEDTLINVGSAHFYMSEKAIYRLTISDLYPTRLDWIHNASGIIYEDETVTGEDGSAPRHIIGGIKSNKVEQSGTIADVTACPSRPPVITAHPGNLTINANPCSASYTDSSELSVTLTGKEPFSYQWQEKLSSASTWANIVGENSFTFKINNPSAADHYNKQYRVGVTNSDLSDTFTDNTCDTSSGSATVNCDSTTKMSVGITVAGSGIQSNTLISSIVNDTSFTLSKTATGTATNTTLTFGDTVYSNHGSITLSGYDTVPSFTTVMSSQDQQASVGDDVTIEARWCTSVTSWTWKSKLPSGSYSNVTIDGTNFTEESGLVPPIGSVAGYYYSRITIKNIQSSQNGVKYKINAVNPAGNTDSGETTIDVIASGGTLTLRSEEDNYYPVFIDDHVGWRHKADATATKGKVSYKDQHRVYWANKRGAQGDEEWGDRFVTDWGTTPPFWPPTEDGQQANDWGGSVYDYGAVFYPPFKWQTLGGTGPYSYEIYRTNDTQGIKTAEAKSIGNGVTLAVERIHMTLSVGDVIKFNASGGTAVFTLTEQALFRSNTLTGNLTGHALQDDLVSIRHWNDNDQIVTPFKDSTCDLIAHSVTSCNTTGDSAAGTTAVTGFSNSNVAAGQIVTGTGVPANTYVLASPAPTSSTCTLNKAVTSNESNTTLVFGTATITCNSNKYIKVGQKVSGEGIPNGAEVSSVNASAVTSFTISTPVTASAANRTLTFDPLISSEFLINISKTKNATDTIDISFAVDSLTGAGFPTKGYPTSLGWVKNSSVPMALGEASYNLVTGYEPMLRVKVTDSAGSPATGTSDYKWLNVYPSWNV